MNLSQVSVVMPNYNGSRYISEAIKSVMNQTYTNWELIIVDDCSTDNSLSIIKPFLADSRIKLLTLDKNQKIANARNKAIELAKGEYIAFLDSDDIWTPHKLEKQLSYFENEGDIAVVYSFYSQIDEKSNDLGKVIRSKTKVTFYDMLKTNSIGCLTAIYSIKKAGKRYFINQSHEDYIYWLFMLRDGFTALGINEVLAKYRVSSSSHSSNKLKAASWQWNIYRNVLKINILMSFYYFLCYAYYGVKKHY